MVSLREEKEERLKRRCVEEEERVKASRGLKRRGLKRRCVEEERVKDEIGK